MGCRTGVISRLNSRVRKGKGGKATLAYIRSILNDPCIYCGEFGCDSIEHIVPKTRKEELSTGSGISHWTNLAPTHKRCNGSRSCKGLLSYLVSKGVVYVEPGDLEVAMQNKQCKCGRIMTNGDPIWCKNCSTYTHPCYVKRLEIQNHGEPKESGGHGLRQA